MKSGVNSLKIMSFYILMTFVLTMFHINYAEAKINTNWREFRSESGSCAVTFPTSPKHMQEQFELPKSKAKITYDAYVSSNEPQIMYMMLIAKYPVAISPEYQRASLEGFINGLIQQGGKVVFVNLLDIENATGVEFFIQNNNVYFKGKVIMKENKLYLVAMESLDIRYQESAYHQFVESFRFTK